MTEIINSGERILPEKESAAMFARHFCAYRLAENYVADKELLDIGCGEGYGSYFLSALAKRVVGIDYNQEIIEHANNKYRRANLSFRALDVKELGSLEDRFDIICAFQVIEHLDDTRLFLGGVKDLLCEHGVFICSTPNRLDASPRSDIPLNKFHIREYLWDEFKALLEGFFSKVRIYGLKRGKKFNFYRRLKKLGLFNFLPEALDPVKGFYGRIGCSDFIITKDDLDTALDFIAVCHK